MAIYNNNNSETTFLKLKVCFTLLAKSLDKRKWLESRFNFSMPISKSSDSGLAPLRSGMLVVRRVARNRPAMLLWLPEYKKGRMSSVRIVLKRKCRESVSSAYDSH